MLAAALELLFVIVDAVMLVQGDSPSFTLVLVLAVVMLLAWGLIRLGKETLGSALGGIANHLS